MSSAYLAISILKTSPMSEKQLRIFSSYLPRVSLKELLSKANIYNGNMFNNDLIDMTISDKDKRRIHTSENDDLTPEEIKNILKIIRNT